MCPDRIDSYSVLVASIGNRLFGVVTPVARLPHLGRSLVRRIVPAPSSGLPVITPGILLLLNSKLA